MVTLPPSNSSPGDRRIWRVLCVDDEPTIRDLLALYLRRKNYSVQTASDGLDAWQKISADPGAIDLVITDNQMPRLDGLGLVRLLREANYPGKVVFFSSSLKYEDAAKLESLGIDAIVEKGSVVEPLLAIIQRLALERQPERDGG